MSRAHNQPQYDFLTGQELPASTSFRQSKRESSVTRNSTAQRPDSSNDEWRAQIHKLQYELDSLKQEREATALRHEDELRRVESKAEADYKRAQAAEHANSAASGKSSKAENDLRDAQEQWATDRGALERKLRASQDAERGLQDEVEELKSNQSSGARKLRHDFDELQANYKTLEEKLQESIRDRDERASAVSTVNQRLSQRETEVGELENEMLRLKAQTGDAETLDVLKRDLSNQVEHIQKLEGTNLDQRIELKQLRKQQKSVEVVEEEKRVMESKLRMMSDLRRELSEAQLQRQILKDEQKSWTSYLENDNTVEGDTRFETPEELAKAYIKTCAENAELVDKLGKVSPDLSAKNETIQSLESDVQRLGQEIQTLRVSEGKAAGVADPKVRLERQRAMAVKEVEYLRAQLKTYDEEQAEFSPEKYDESKTKRVQELEEAVDQYRKEMQTLHEALNKKYDPTNSSHRTLKRPHDDDDDNGTNNERLGELTRKNRTLQDQLSHQTTTYSLLQKELSATKSQLTSLKSSSSTRILELRQNPTSAAQTIKTDMLATLREENENLLARLNSSSFTSEPADTTAPTPPAATLTRLRAELSIQKEENSTLHKRTDRLKKVWAAKSREWRQTVAQTLGWDFDFQPNGRVRVTSTFNPGIPEEEGGDGSNSIIFDGEKGTMKCSGGPRSVFASGIDEDIRFWVDDKKEVPCFLATLTLKFWDETTKAQRVI